jgi:hypothetical protein
MNYRKTKFYKNLTDTIDASEYAQGMGLGETATITERLIAWQWLVDRGVILQWGGWFVEEAEFLIAKGLIQGGETK